MRTKTSFLATTTLSFLSANQAFTPQLVHPRTSSSTITYANLDHQNRDENTSRRDVLALLGASTTLLGGFTKPAFADRPDSLDVDSFLKYGQVSNPMGVSGQAGKSRPETGVVLREGSEVSRDSRSGNVLAEILLGTKEDPIAVLATFTSPWPLAKGSVFDVECRDAKTGEGAFLTVTSSTDNKSIADLPNSYFTDQLFQPYGRFSLYGTPTDVKIKKNTVKDDYRFLELSFSNLSQSTQTEIPRNAIVAATIPKDTDEVVMLVASATAARWRKGAEEEVRKTVESFRAVPAPKSSLKIRAKVRDTSLL